MGFLFSGILNQEEILTIYIGIMLSLINFLLLEDYRPRGYNNDPYITS
jgi:hypothetical protein